MLEIEQTMVEQTERHGIKSKRTNKSAAVT